MKVKSLRVAAIAAGLAVVGTFACASPAVALGTAQPDNYIGHSFLQPSTNWLEVQTLYNVTSANVRVCAQGRVIAGNQLITSVPKACASQNSFVQWEYTSGIQSPGGRHWEANGKSFDT